MPGTKYENGYTDGFRLMEITAEPEGPERTAHCLAQMDKINPLMTDEDYKKGFSDGCNAGYSKFFIQPEASLEINRT